MQYQYAEGTKLSFTLMYPASDSLRKEVALAVSSDLAKIGVEAKVEGQSWDAIKERVKNDANVFGWGLPYDPDLELYSLYHRACLTRALILARVTCSAMNFLPCSMSPPRRRCLKQFVPSRRRARSWSLVLCSLVFL